MAWATDSRTKSTVKNASARSDYAVAETIAPSGAHRPLADTQMRSNTSFLTVANNVGLVGVTYAAESLATAMDDFNAVTVSVYCEKTITANAAVTSRVTPSDVSIRQSRSGVFSELSLTPTVLQRGDLLGMSYNYSEETLAIGQNAAMDDNAAANRSYREDYTLPLLGKKGDTLRVAGNVTGSAGVGVTVTPAVTVFIITFHNKPNLRICGPKEFVQIVKTIGTAVLAAGTIGAPSRAVIQLSQPQYSNPRPFAVAVQVQTGVGIAATFVEWITALHWNPSGLGPYDQAFRGALDNRRFNNGGSHTTAGFVGGTFQERPHVPNECIEIWNGPNAASGVAPHVNVAYVCEV